MAEKSTITLISPYEINIALGIRSISSYLKSQGHQVNLIFLALQKSNPGHFHRGKGPFVRKRNLNNVIQEIKSMTDRYDFIQNISILDETFFVRSQKEIETFSRLYREGGIKRAISCSLSPHTLTDRKLKPLVEAGLFRVSVGIQSLSGRTLQEIYNRPSSMSLIKKTIHLINKYKKQVRRPVYHLIVDNPDESKESLKTSIEFVMSLPARTKFNIYPLVLYPGTEIYKKANRDGFIQDEIKEIYMNSWTIDDVQDLDFLTILLYYAVWTKFSRPAMLVTNRVIGVLLNDRIITWMDRKFIVKGMLYSLKFFIFSLNQGRKIKKVLNRG